MQFQKWNENFKQILLTIFLFSALWGQTPVVLLDTLNGEKGWRPVNYLDDGTRFERKTIVGKTLSAVKVSRVTDVTPHFIRNVIMDLDHYGEFLSNANTLNSAILKITDEYVEGYQHIRVALPFFSDRQYCFRMTAYEWLQDSNNIIIEWYLLDNEGEYASFLKKQDSQAVYLDFGAGSWSAKALGNGRFEISYQLYMDPGGSIPNFLNQRVNAISIINLFQDALMEADRRMKVDKHPKLDSPPNTTGLKSYRF